MPHPPLTEFDAANFKVPFYIAIDVSGSIDQDKDMLKRAWALAETFDVDQPTILAFSHECYEVQSLEDLYKAAGGGSDLQCVKNHVEVHGAGHVIVVTDGYVDNNTIPPDWTYVIYPESLDRQPTWLDRFPNKYLLPY